MNLTKIITALLATVFLAGCASFNAPLVYVPQKAGNLADGDVGAALAVVLKADRDFIRRGDPLGLRP